MNWLTPTTGSGTLTARSFKTPQVAVDRTRQISGFFVPERNADSASRSAGVHSVPVNGRDGGPNTTPLWGNKAGTLLGVLNHPGHPFTLNGWNLQKSQVGGSL